MNHLSSDQLILKFGLQYIILLKLVVSLGCLQNSNNSTFILHNFQRIEYQHLTLNGRIEWHCYFKIDLSPAQEHLFLQINTIR